MTKYEKRRDNDQYVNATLFEIKWWNYSKKKNKTKQKFLLMEIMENQQILQTSQQYCGLRKWNKINLEKFDGITTQCEKSEVRISKRKEKHIWNVTYHDNFELKKQMQRNEVILLFQKRGERMYARCAGVKK